MSRNTGIMAEMDYRYFVLYTVLWVGIKRRWVFQLPVPTNPKAPAARGLLMKPPLPAAAAPNVAPAAAPTPAPIRVLRSRRWFSSFTLRTSGF
jgi:hypothetical protein